MSNQNKERVYVGSGKQVGDYEIVNISIQASKLKDAWYDYNGEKYARLTVAKKREVDQYGKTHTVYVNDYKPEEGTSKPKANQAKAGDGLPF
jgi:hypothetical protein